MRPIPPGDISRRHSSWSRCSILRSDMRYATFLVCAAPLEPGWPVCAGADERPEQRPEIRCEAQHRPRLLLPFLRTASRAPSAAGRAVQPGIAGPMALPGLAAGDEA